MFPLVQSIMWIIQFVNLSVVHPNKCTNDDHTNSVDIHNLAVQCLQPEDTTCQLARNDGFPLSITIFLLVQGLFD